MGRNSHTYGSKPWELQVKTMALLGRKPQGYEMPNLEWRKGCVLPITAKVLNLVLGGAIFCGKYR